METIANTFIYFVKHIDWSFITKEIKFETFGTILNSIYYSLFT